MCRTDVEQACETQSRADLVQKNVQQKRYGGIGRLWYFVGILGWSALCYFCFGDAVKVGEPPVPLGSVVVGIVTLVLTANRLRNIGMNAWWFLLALVPIANVYVFIKCFLCPEGYEDTKKLDRTGKVIAGICLTCILLSVVAVVL